MKVNELKPSQKKIELILKIEEIAPSREVVTQSDGLFHKVAEALAGDETGCIYLSLWDLDIENVARGEYYKITNAYITTYKNAMRLNSGKYGKIEKATGNFEINTANNLSLKEL
ncbi:MAG TPA: hypothetical protein VJG83_05715 [archaeon]|nr:hypothetical protein [archaeon]